jgi:hypothetical protein
MFFRLILSLAVALVLSCSAHAAEPHLRVGVVEDELVEAVASTRNEDSDSTAAMKFHPKMEFSFDKSFQCRGAADPAKGGAFKKCDASMKKKIALGLGPIEMASAIAADMEGLFQELMPSQESFLRYPS